MHWAVCQCCTLAYALGCLPQGSLWRPCSTVRNRFSAAVQHMAALFQWAPLRHLMAVPAVSACCLHQIAAARGPASYLCCSHVWAGIYICFGLLHQAALLSRHDLECMDMRQA